MMQMTATSRLMTVRELRQLIQSGRFKDSIEYVCLEDV